MRQYKPHEVQTTRLIIIHTIQIYERKKVIIFSLYMNMDCGVHCIINKLLSFSVQRVQKSHNTFLNLAMHAFIASTTLSFNSLINFQLHGL